jgi:hypothetical protein
VDDENGDSKVLPPLSTATNLSNDDRDTNTNVEGEESFAFPDGNSPNSPKNGNIPNGSVNSEKALKVDG